MATVLFFSTDAQVHDPRRLAIQKSIGEISDEVQRYAGGDGHQWFDQLAPVRSALSAAIDDAVQHPRTSDHGKRHVPLVVARGNSPMFTDPNGAGYLCLWGPYKADDREVWLRTRAVGEVLSAVQAWRSAANIDLIVVPGPMMARDLPDRIVPGVPDNLIVVPQLRELLLHILQNDVEVVDFVPGRS